MNPHDPSDPKRKPPLGLLSGLRIGSMPSEKACDYTDKLLAPTREPPHLERRHAWHEILLCHEGTRH
jgi:hypothetical protein